MKTYIVVLEWANSGDHLRIRKIQRTSNLPRIGESICFRSFTEFPLGVTVKDISHEVEDNIASVLCRCSWETLCEIYAKKRGWEITVLVNDTREKFLKDVRILRRKKQRSKQ